MTGTERTDAEGHLGLDDLGAGVEGGLEFLLGLLGALALLEGLLLLFLLLEFLVAALLRFLLLDDLDLLLNLGGLVLVLQAERLWERGERSCAQECGGGRESVEGVQDDGGELRCVQVSSRECTCGVRGE